MREVVGSRLPVFTMEEMNNLNGSLDFIGLNHYTTLYVKDCMLSSCSSIDTTLGDAMVYTTGERDGNLIGDAVRERERERQTSS